MFREERSKRCVPGSRAYQLGALPRANLPKEHKEESAMAKSKFKITPIQIIGVVCILLMIAMIATQFLPFWTIDEGTTLSISDYTWFNSNKEYKNFIKEMKANLKDAGLMTADELKEFKINNFVYPPVVLLLVSLFGLGFCPFKLGKPLGHAFNLAVGCIGIWMYLGHPIYQLGANWQLHLALSIALLALTAVNIVLSLIKYFRANYEIVYTPAKK